MAIADGNRFGNVLSSPGSAALAAAGHGAGDLPRCPGVSGETPARLLVNSLLHAKTS